MNTPNLKEVIWQKYGHWLVTGSGDKTARLWDLSAKDPTANP